jgi:uncharacterized CHY-type Zn-finger protein
VSDFLINPVLRQARRFSRSNPSPDHIDPATAPRTVPKDSNESAIEDIAEHLDGLTGLEETRTARNGSSRNISGAPLTSSPIEEDGGLEAELEALEARRPPSAPAAFGPVHVIPLRVASLRSESGQTDDDITENPTVGFPGRFRTTSANSTTRSFSSLGRNAIDARMSPAEGPSRRSAQDAVSSTSHNRSSSLPEDDGMGILRQQIILIQSMGVPAEEKARMMHQLLTKEYSQTRETFHSKHLPNAPSPATMISQERPTTPGSLSSFLWQMNGALDAAAPEQQHTFHLSPDDLKRTYAPPDPPETDEDGDVRIKDEVQVLGCRHYKRNVKLQCSACDRWYTCRLCHDEAEDHILNRKATKNMLCMVCGCAQRAGEFCVGCGERTAWYYCSVCKLWDNDSNKNIYHCHDCGICRKGRGLGKDFFHCKVSSCNTYYMHVLITFRRVVPACPCQLSTPTNASSVSLTATVQFVVNICSLLLLLWSSCCAVTVSTKHATMNT